MIDTGPNRMGGMQPNPINRPPRPMPNPMMGGNRPLRPMGPGMTPSQSNLPITPMPSIPIGNQSSPMGPMIPPQTGGLESFPPRPNIPQPMGPMLTGPIDTAPMGRVGMGGFNPSNNMQESAPSYQEPNLQIPGMTPENSGMNNPELLRRAFGNR